MARLTALQIKNAKKRGLLCDGDGLNLQISASGAKSWIFRFRMDGKNRDHGLGSLKTLNLAEAREAARECRQFRLKGLNPIDEKKKRAIAVKLEAGKCLTFKDCTEQYVAAHKNGWKENRHRDKWERSLELHA